MCPFHLIRWSLSHTPWLDGHNPYSPGRAPFIPESARIDLGYNLPLTSLGKGTEGHRTSPQNELPWILVNCKERKS